ncbi:acyltransferase [Hoeflea sp. CAU 1731]
MELLREKIHLERTRRSQTYRKGGVKTPLTFYPYGDEYAHIWRFGYLGVELFFIISGFVIFSSLQSRQSIIVFAVRRFTRLWPPMLICSVMTFMVMASLDNPFTTLKNVQFLDFIPSLTLTKPPLWTWLSPDINYIDDAYWSLFVEVRFYFWISIIFAIWREKSWIAFLVMSASTTIIHIFLIHSELNKLHQIFNQLFFPKYIYLFCAGIIFSVVYETKFSKWHFGGLAYCIIASFIFFRIAEIVIISIFFIIFALLLYNRKIILFLKNPVLVWIGLSSYSIYLLHQNIGVAFIVNDPNAGVSRAVIAILGSIVLGTIVHLTIERRSGALSLAILRQFGVDGRKL